MGISTIAVVDPYDSELLLSFTQVHATLQIFHLPSVVLLECRQYSFMNQISN